MGGRRPEDPERRQLAGSGDGWKGEQEERKSSVGQPRGSCWYHQGWMIGKGGNSF